MKKNKILLILIFVLFVGYLIYSYVYKSHRDIASEKGSFLVTVDAVYNEFTANQQKANQKYLDKTIEVYGKISSIDYKEKTIVLDEKLFAVFNDGLPSDLKVFSGIKIKGRFIGYDDLLGELKMDQCMIQKE